MNSRVIERYLAHLNTASQALERLSQYIDDNGEVAPDDLDWSHVGSMEYLASQLVMLQDMIDGTGEFAS